MRGARVPASFRASLMRIIPADAGSTTVAEAVTAKGRDHPRRCGEHRVVVLCALATAGSSPQMRGALKIVIWPYDKIGIIPADAGSTVGLWFVWLTWWDHPRRCGEHT